MKFAIILSLMIFGCSDASPEHKELGDASLEEKQRLPYPTDVEGVDHGDTMCRHSEHIVFEWDGGSKIYDIPLPCDPFWEMKDRGDPAP